MVLFLCEAQALYKNKSTVKHICFTILCVFVDGFFWIFNFLQYHLHHVLFYVTTIYCDSETAIYCGSVFSFKKKFELGLNTKQQNFVKKQRIVNKLLKKLAKSIDLRYIIWYKYIVFVICTRG